VPLDVDQARVVDEDVDAAEGLDRRLEDPVDLERAGDVRDDGDRPLADRGGRLLGARLVDVVDDDPRALLREALRDPAADPVAGAGDHRDLPVEPPHRDLLVVP